MRMNDSTHITAATTPATPPDDVRRHTHSFRSSPKKSLDDLQVDLPNAALDLYAEVDVRFAVGVVDVRVAYPLEPLGIDLAQATFGFRLNPYVAWKQYRCLSNPALYAGVEALHVIAREIHCGLACSHLKINSPQGEAVQIQIALSRAHLHHEIGWHFVVQADVPLVTCVTTEAGALGASLLHHKLTLLTANVVAHFWLPV